MAIKYTVFTKDFKCPHCGYVYESASSTNPNKTNAKYNFKHYIGSPIKECPKCGSNFIDKRYNEYLLMTPIERNHYFDGYKSSGPTVWIIIILAYIISFVIGALASEMYLMLIGAGVGLLLLLIPISVSRSRTKMITSHIFDEEIQKSLLRFKDKNYANILLSHGFTIYPLSELELQSNKNFITQNNLEDILK